MRVSNYNDVPVESTTQQGNGGLPTAKRVRAQKPSNMNTKADSVPSSYSQQQSRMDIENRGLRELENIDKRKEWIESDTKQLIATMFVSAANETLDGSGNPFVFSPSVYPFEPIIKLHSTPI